MRRMICALLAGLFLGMVFQETSFAQKKKVPMTDNGGKKLPQQKQSYEDLFRDKQVRTSRGLMTIHAVKDQGQDRVYVEFPEKLLGREMMLTSVIREISTSGLGAVGQFNDFTYLKFTKLESQLLVKLIVGDEPLEAGREPGIGDLLEKSHQPGVWQSLTVLAYTPDSSAMVVDMTSIFMENSKYANLFTAFNGNVMTQHIPDMMVRPRQELNKLIQVSAFEKSIAVTGNFHFWVDFGFAGARQERNNPVFVIGDRILMLLPEQVMRPRLADVRIGTALLEKTVIEGGSEIFRKKKYALRWRLEPADSVAYEAGQPVEPKKPIVFYMDTLIPLEWKRAVKDGVEAWNKAFEQAGFKNVVRVKEFPGNDPKFSAFDISHSVIRYAPGLQDNVHNSMHTDARSGEILNASILISGDLMQNLSDHYKTTMMATDPAARTNGALPVATRYELIKSCLCQMSGRCLGLVSNAKSDGAFPVDSLLSPSFTQKYGVSPSIMGYYITYNYIATEKDVARGVRLMPQMPGEYDCYAIKWLYAPIIQAKTPEEELPVLEKWIAKEKDNRACAYGRPHPMMYDPSLSPGILGDDALRSMACYRRNTRYALEHLEQWYAGEDKDYTNRMKYINQLIGEIGFKFRMLSGYFGGFYMNYGEKGVTYDFIPREVEKKCMDFYFDWMYEILTLNAFNMEKKIGLSDDRTRKLAWDLFTQMFGRVVFMYFGEEKSNVCYTAEEFMEEMNRRIWGPAQNGRPLKEIEKVMQMNMLGSMLKSSGIQTLPQRMPQGMMQSGGGGMSKGFFGQDTEQNSLYFDLNLDFGVIRKPVQAIYYRMLLRTKKQIEEAIPKSNGDTREHYEYMLYKMNDLMTLRK